MQTARNPMESLCNSTRQNFKLNRRIEELYDTAIKIFTASGKFFLNPSTFMWPRVDIFALLPALSSSGMP